MWCLQIDTAMLSRIIVFLQMGFLGWVTLICEEGLHYGEAHESERDLLCSQVLEEGGTAHGGPHGKSSNGVRGEWWPEGPRWSKQVKPSGDFISAFECH